MREYAKVGELLVRSEKTGRYPKRPYSSPFEQSVNGIGNGKGTRIDIIQARKDPDLQMFVVAVETVADARLKT